MSNQPQHQPAPTPEPPSQTTLTVPLDLEALIALVEERVVENLTRAIEQMMRNRPSRP